MYSVATDHAAKFHPERSFTEKHVPLLRKLFGESRVYEVNARARYAFDWQGSAVPNEVRDYARDGFREERFDTEDKTEAECSLIAERLQRSLDLLADDMSKVNYIKGLTSNGLSDAAAVLFLIWKELHALNGRME